MPAQNVDLVFVIDASESMGPCFTQLKKHLQSLLYPLEQASYKVRFGLVAYAAGKSGRETIYDHYFIGGSGHPMMQSLYGGQASPDRFFTNSPQKLCQVLEGIRPQGNEDTLLALDIALDFPFGPAQSTKRVVALFTDEKLEDGIEGPAPLSKMSELVKKMQDRRVQFFGALPSSDGAERLAEVDRAEVEFVEGGDGLGRVNFQQLLNQMGKSISINTLQATGEPPYKKAVFGQDRWKDGKSATQATRQKILATGESCTLNTSEPITRINVKLKWTASVDLDLHAFLKTKRGLEEHVYFGTKTGTDINLDKDAGVGDIGGQNEENITMTSLDNMEQVLFATKIFKKGGSYADYDGKVTVQTNNGDDITVPLSAQETADWCVIAKINNRNQSSPEVVNVNRVTDIEPSVDDFWS